MVCVSEPENVAHILDHDVLKATSGSQEGNAPLSRRPNHLKNSIRVPVGASRCNEKAVKPV